MRPYLSRVAWLLTSLATTAAFVGAWSVIARLQLVSPIYLPTPARTLNALVHGLQGGALEAQSLGTVWHMIAGWLVASAFGIVLGAVIGASDTIRAYLDPMLESLRPLPASALVPIAVALFGLSESMVIAIVAFGAIWPVMLGTIHGISTVDRRLVEVSQLLEMQRFAFIRKVVLPHAIPDVVAGMKLSLTIALILSVVGEMISSSHGLGQWLLLASRSFQSANLFAGVVLLGLLGLISSVCIDRVESYLLRWRSQ